MPGNYIYTAEDIQRYHSGKMPEAEMHAMERAAMLDPFLADAIEGYVYTNTPVEDVAELREKILSSTNQSDRRPVRVWLKIAAILILVTGIGYVTYILNMEKNKNSLAVNEQKEYKKTDDESQSLQPDSAITTMKSDKVPVEEKTKSNKIKKDVANTTPNSELPTPNSTVISVPNEDVAIFSKMHNDRVMEGKVTDDKGNALSKAFLKDEQLNRAVRTDSMGQYKLPGGDTVITAVVAADGYKTQEFVLRDNANQTIVMKPESKEPGKKELREVSVTANGTKKSKEEKYRNTASRSSYNTMLLSYKDSTHAPVGGWDNFKQYVFENITAPLNPKGEKYTGTVVLSFEVGRRGNPKNVMVESPLCDPCDKEAQRVLVNGPKWKAGQERRSLEIKF